MDPVLSEIYKTVLGAAPYVLAAYGLLWVGLFAYVAAVLTRVGRLEKRLGVIEEAVERRAASGATVADGQR
ncbi:MAG: CcmD family protein [Coriobacteriia bacterium]